MQNCSWKGWELNVLPLNWRLEQPGELHEEFPKLSPHRKTVQLKHLEPVSWSLLELQSRKIHIFLCCTIMAFLGGVQNARFFRLLNTHVKQPLPRHLQQKETSLLCFCSHDWLWRQGWIKKWKVFHISVQCYTALRTAEVHFIHLAGKYLQSKLPQGPENTKESSN